MTEHVTEHPVNLTTEHVDRVLANAKTQLRRPISLPRAPAGLGAWEPTTVGGPGVTTAPGGGDPVPVMVAMWHTRTGKIIAAPMQRGHQIWVRESWCLRDRAFHPDGGYWYSATDDVEGYNGRSPWKSSTTMPRAACRIALEVTDVRVQRASQVTVEDAYAEGFVADAGQESSQALTRMIARWNIVNYRTPWADNPWMWTISFRRLLP